MLRLYSLPSTNTSCVELPIFGVDPVTDLRISTPSEPLRVLHAQWARSPLRRRSASRRRKARAGSRRRVCGPGARSRLHGTRWASRPAMGWTSYSFRRCGLVYDVPKTSDAPARAVVVLGSSCLKSVMVLTVDDCEIIRRYSSCETLGDIVCFPSLQPALTRWGRASS